MYDWLLFLHLLAAFALVAAVIMFSSAVLGAVVAPRVMSVSGVLEDVGGMGTLVFGIWLALYVDVYEIWDGWILGAIVLWALSAEAGRRFRKDTEPGGAQAAATIHWVRSALVLALLAIMIFKPGA